MGTETHLPLTNQSSCVQVDQVLDLSMCRICMHVSHLHVNLTLLYTHTYNILVAGVLM